MQQPRKLKELKTYSLQARDGEIGKVQEVYFDDAQWSVRYLVVRTGGWLLGREVLISPAAITGLDEENRRISVDLTCEMVEKSPPVESKKPVSRHYEAAYHHYYGWEPYWAGGRVGAGPGLPRLLPAPPEFPGEPEHPHLRSSEEIRGYGIRARDGDIGQVEDLIVDDGSWKIPYLEIDTGKWLPVKKVLVAPAWIERIDWAAREIAVDLERETIESAPPYDASRVIGHDDEVNFYAHYGKSRTEEDKSASASARTTP